MRDKVLQTIRDGSLLEQGDRVTVGLSGGADSVALLCVLQELRCELGISLQAVHVNHCLRGAEADRDEAFCEALCRSIGVSFASVRCDVPAYCAGHRVSEEVGARVLRYEALRRAAAGGKIATAHHLEDHAETVLLNLVRGTALDGLCGIPLKRDDIIRPLLFCTRGEVEEYLSARGQSYCTDSTNLNDSTARNRLRHTVLPILCEMNPSFYRGVLRMTRALSADREFLDEQADALFAFAVSEGRIRCESYRGALEAIRLRVLRRYFFQEKIAFDFDRLSFCDNLILSGEGSRPVAKGVVFTVKENAAFFKRKQPPQSAAATTVTEKMLSDGAILSYAAGKKIQIRPLSQKEIKLFVNCGSKEYKNSVDCDKIKEPALFRPRRAGDAILPVGRQHTRTLKKWMNEAGVPVEQRDALAVFADSSGPLWAEGFGTAKKAALTPETKRAVLLTTIREED